MSVLIAVAMLLLPLLAQWAANPPRRAPAMVRPLDIGVLFAWVVAVYGALPLAGLALAREGIGAIGELRLGDTLPDVAAVEQVGLTHLSFLAGFVLLYIWARDRSSPLAARALLRPGGGDVAVALGLWLAIQVGLIAARAAYGLGSSEDYLSSYAELNELPLLVRQLIGTAQAVDFAAAVLAIVVTMAWNPRLHAVVALCVVALVAETLVVGGSRSQAFLCGLAYVVARSVYGPRLKWASLIAFGLAGVLAFALAGALRQSRIADETFSPLALLQGGEFMAFFFTGIDLRERAADLAELGLTPGLYFVDLLRLLPRQIVGDVKVDPAVLYVSTFYPEFYEAGGGLAFGAIAESILGQGMPEALIRGALLGTAYAWVRNGLQRPQVSVLRVFVYVWFVVLAYQGLRDTTFSVFARFVLQVLPILILLRLPGLLRPSRAGRASTAPAGRAATRWSRPAEGQP